MYTKITKMEASKISTLSAHSPVQIQILYAKSYGKSYGLSSTDVDPVVLLYGLP